MLYAIGYLIKKHFLMGPGGRQQSGKIQILSTQILMPKKYLSIVKVNNRVYLLAASEQSITLIDKFENTEEFDEPAGKQFIKGNNLFDTIKKNTMRR